jgi:ankyrin repeat protein
VAATNGDSELVSLLVAHGADPNFVVDQERWRVALTVAVIKGHEEIVPMLIAGTVNLHRTRALATAVKQGKRQIAEMRLLSGAQLLLKYGADVNVECSEYPDRRTGKILTTSYSGPWRIPRRQWSICY